LKGRKGEEEKGRFCGEHWARSKEQGARTIPQAPSLQPHAADFKIKVNLIYNFSVITNYK
jgi:hypothetical protein